jgi:hypothetical protein
VCRVPGLPLIQILTHIGHRRHIRRLRLICATKKNPIRMQQSLGFP